MTVEWLTAGAAAGGVVNSYAVPAQLGADRWVSLIAARKRAIESELFPSACIVVNAGTAVTIDALDAGGVFRGGIILPGIQLMLRALSDNTAALKVAPASSPIFRAAPRTPCIRARCRRSAVQSSRCGRSSATTTPASKCFLAGGLAREIAPHLAGPVEVVDNLVLEGVLVLASGWEP